MMRSPFRIARGPMRWLLVVVGAVGIAMPWGRAYMLEPWHRDRQTRRHELVHLRQIKRDGPVLFSLRYMWWLLRYGYRRNPYEIEAYAAERPGEGKPRRWLSRAGSKG